LITDAQKKKEISKIKILKNFEKKYKIEKSEYEMFYKVKLKVFHFQTEAIASSPINAKNEAHRLMIEKG
jgi:hypothetical protein